MTDLACLLGISWQRNFQFRGDALKTVAPCEKVDAFKRDAMFFLCEYNPEKLLNETNKKRPVKAVDVKLTILCCIEWQRSFDFQLNQFNVTKDETAKVLNFVEIIK